MAAWGNMAAFKVDYDEETELEEAIESDKPIHTPSFLKAIRVVSRARGVADKEKIRILIGEGTLRMSLLLALLGGLLTSLSPCVIPLLPLAAVKKPCRISCIYD